MSSGVTVRRRTLDHISGSKQYHIVTITNPSNGKGISIMRWGRTRRWGQVKVETGWIRKIQISVENKIAEKITRSYTPKHDLWREDLDEKQAREFLGAQYLREITPMQWKTLFPHSDCEGLRDNPPSYRIGAGATTEITATVRDEEEAPQPVPTIDQRVAENENWGLF